MNSKPIFAPWLPGFFIALSCNGNGSVEDGKDLSVLKFSGTAGFVDSRSACAVRRSNDASA